MWHCKKISIVSFWNERVSWRDALYIWLKQELIDELSKVNTVGCISGRIARDLGNFCLEDRIRKTKEKKKRRVDEQSQSTINVAKSKPGEDYNVD